MKLKTKLLFFILFVFSMNTVVFSQSENTKNPDKVNYKHAIGVAAGFTTGYGLSYRYTPDKLGLQVTFAPYKDKTSSKYSTGLSFIYYLIYFETTNLFLYQSNHFYYSSYKDTYYSYSSGNTITKTNVTNYFNNGIGVGIEIMQYKRISSNIMFGYAAYNNFEMFNLSGEFGLYFKL